MSDYKGTVGTMKGKWREYCQGLTEVTLQPTTRNRAVTGETEPGEVE